MRVKTQPGEVGEPWSRRKLMALLAGVLATVLLLVAGLTLTVVQAITAAPSSDEVADLAEEFPVGPDGVRGEDYRDAVAAAPMLEATADDLKFAPTTLETTPAIAIPAATGVGEIGVPTGFPQTPEGAIGQLAAIVTTVLPVMSVDGARAVHEAWADSGADFGSWPILLAIQSFHASAGTIDGDGEISMTVVPVGAQIKGTDGDAWVLACVQLDVQVVVNQKVRFGFGHCERMEWEGDRWQIGAGDPPDLAPSTWPGSQRSLDAGWMTYVEGGR